MGRTLPWCEMSRTVHAVGSPLAERLKLTCNGFGGSSVCRFGLCDSRRGAPLWLCPATDRMCLGLSAGDVMAGTDLRLFA